MFSLPAIKSENGLRGVVGDTLREAHNVLVEGAADILKVGKDEGLFGVKACSDDVFGVLLAVSNDFVDGSLFREQELFVYIVD